MAKQLKLKRGTTSQHGSFTGAEGEVTVDTDKETLVVHDGSTAGGHPVAAEDMANVSSASITGRLASGAIVGSKIASDAVTGVKIANASVTTAKIADSNVTTAKINDDAVTSAKIADGAITSAHIAADTVVAADIAANAVGTSEIADDAVTTNQIAVGSIVTNRLAADAVTGAQIADNAIDSEHYVDGSIDNAHLAANSVSNTNIIDGNITTSELSTAAVTEVKLAADCVSGAKIQDNAINSEHIAADSIDAEHYAPNSVDADALAHTSVTAGSYGSATAIPAITVDAQGRITAASTNTVNTTTNLGTSTATGSFTITSSTGNNATISEATGSAAGVMSTAHHNKLDGIESGATADQSNAEIRAAVEAASDSNVFTDADHSKLNGIASSANNYSHPSHPGDDFSIDTGHLSGATVIDDIDINVTTDGSGHVTDCNGSVATRNLTLGDLGYTGATNANNYSHPSYNGDDFSIDTGHLSGATVIDDIDINVTTDGSGHVTDCNGTVATRNLTLGDLGFSGATNANYITNNNQLSNGAGYITSQQTNASNLSSGTLPDGRFPSTLPAVSGANLTNVSAGGASNISFNSGNGINFSATGDGNGTDSSELFDDYEEGTWTIDLEWSSNGSSWSNLGTSGIDTTTGYYTKIGNIVHAWFYSGTFNPDRDNKLARINGLPYTSQNAGSGYQGGAVFWHTTCFQGYYNSTPMHQEVQSGFVEKNTTVLKPSLPFTHAEAYWRETQNLRVGFLVTYHAA